jgi:hypothetical protein
MPSESISVRLDSPYSLMLSVYLRELGTNKTKRFDVSTKIISKCLASPSKMIHRNCHNRLATIFISLRCSCLSWWLGGVGAGELGRLVKGCLATEPRTSTLATVWKPELPRRPKPPHGSKTLEKFYPAYLHPPFGNFRNRLQHQVRLFLYSSILGRPRQFLET